MAEPILPQSQDEAARRASAHEALRRTATALQRHASERSRHRPWMVLPGLDAANPIGLAAGFDKDGAQLPFLEGIGFGCIEIGTLTPRAGNGPDVEAVLENVRRSRPARVSRLGISIGPGRATPACEVDADVLPLLVRVWEPADYIAVNLSTSGVQEDPEALRLLLLQLREARGCLARCSGQPRPVAVKLRLAALARPEVRSALRAARPDAVISSSAPPPACQRTTDCPAQREVQAATDVPAAIRALVAALPGVAVFSVGGVRTAADVRERLTGGARMVQLYAVPVEHGPLATRAFIEAAWRPVPEACALSRSPEPWPGG
jgi:dihydroorotate dehydrogenase